MVSRAQSLKDSKAANDRVSHRFSSGVTVFKPTKHSTLGQADPYSKDPGKRPATDPYGPGGYWERQAAALGQPPQTPGETLNLSPLNGDNGMGGGGGGGGGRGGPNPAQIRAIADQTFKLDESPYWMMQAGLDNQRRQAAAYNPDFAGMERETLAGQGAAATARSQAVQQRMAELKELGAALAAQQGSGIAGAVRDLGAQGFNATPFVNQANQMGAAQTGALTNQGAYMTMLDQSAANAQAGDARAAGLIRQGGEATFGNNRTALYNQLDQQAAQIQQQAAQQRLANNQARQEFLLKYGVV